MRWLVSFELLLSIVLSKPSLPRDLYIHTFYHQKSRFEKMKEYKDLPEIVRIAIANEILAWPRDSGGLKLMNDSEREEQRR